MAGCLHAIKADRGATHADSDWNTLSVMLTNHVCNIGSGVLLTSPSIQRIRNDSNHGRCGGILPNPDVIFTESEFETAYKIVLAKNLVAFCEQSEFENMSSPGDKPSAGESVVYSSAMEHWGI
jgi:hypothetical protein